ncbi:MAG TPA: cupin domain-containing protein [Candidatus Ozemobacteraceae bacterium]|nr:cupin domain-containing protein [Candidatus Ozemobacteraceae bacterium]
MSTTRKFCWLWACAFAGSLILASSDPSSAFNLFKKKKKKAQQTTDKAADSKTPAKPLRKIPAVTSHHFFAFEDAPYYTSADKRIGVKMVVDAVKVGPTMAATQHITFLPGASMPSHRHVYVTEVVYVLKGNLTLRIDKETKVMGPDSCAYIPPQTFHEYANTSDDVCQWLQIYSPAGPEEEYRNWETPDTPKVTATEKPVATGTQHIVAPPRQPLPGSPIPHLDTVKESDVPTTEAASQTLQLKAPAAASMTLQLKKADPTAKPIKKAN